MNNQFSNLTLNWHFTDACNMKCRFCFASKSCKSHCLSYKSVLDKCSIFSRINFVGGEPTLAKELPQMVEYASGLNLQTSIVTNAFKAIASSNTSLYNVFSKMTTVGFSVDSLVANTNLSIGRHVNGQTISRDEAIAFCQKIKSLGVELKINTVVNSYNKLEDFNLFIEEVAPSRWKIFQVMPIANTAINKELEVSKYQFASFLSRHKQFESIIYAEDNDMIKDSYIMLNANGYFLDTAPYTVATWQKSLYNKDTNVLEELSKMNYDLSKYHKRYKVAI